MNAAGTRREGVRKKWELCPYCTGDSLIHDFHCRRPTPPRPVKPRPIEGDEHAKGE